MRTRPETFANFQLKICEHGDRRQRRRRGKPEFPARSVVSRGAWPNPGMGGWGGRDRTSEWRNQNPLNSRVKSMNLLSFLPPFTHSAIGKFPEFRMRAGGGEHERCGKCGTVSAAAAIAVPTHKSIELTVRPNMFVTRMSRAVKSARRQPPQEGRPRSTAARVPKRWTLAHADFRPLRTR